MYANLRFALLNNNTYSGFYDITNVYSILTFFLCEQATVLPVTTLLSNSDSLPIINKNFLNFLDLTELKTWSSLLNVKNTFIETKKNIFSIRQTGFFLLTPSPWPVFSAFAAFLMLTGFAAYMNYYAEGLFCFLLGVFFIILAFFFWCRDLIREMTFFGRTSLLIEGNIRFAFWLFIVSEALLFFSFFWAFFHAAFEPGIQLGAVWPPLESIQMNSLDIPIANTIFLLASGAALTWVQYGLIAGQYKEVLLGFTVLFFYAIFFMMSQWHEYVVAFHQVNDSVFGSSMYILTVFHGFHVFIGSVFLFICLLRFLLGHFKTVSYLAITLAAWYWHFVDVVWVFVFLWIYLWGTWIPHYFLEMFIENLTNI